MKDLAIEALNTAQVQGASYADVRVVERVTEGISTKNGTVDGIANGTTRGFNVRVLVNGAWGFSASAVMTKQEAQRVASEAVRIARASAQVAGAPAQLSPLPPQRGTYTTPVQRDPFQVPLDEKINLLLTADAAMHSISGIAVTTGNMEYSRETKLFMSTEGSEIDQVLYDTGAAIVAIAVDQESGEMQQRSYPNSFGRHAGTAGYEFITAMDLVGNAPRLAEQAVQLLTAKQLEPGVRTIILDGPQTAIQIHESCGHPIELDRVMGLEAGFVGKSFLTTDKLNTFMYGSEFVNITADAVTPGALGTFGWDDEGVPAQSTDIVRQGLFTGYLMSRDTAPTLGLASNGCVRADSWNRLPMIRMTNVSLQPGTWKLGDLIADTADGLYLCTNRSWSIDNLRLNFQFATEVGWEIKDGKLGAMIKNPTYTGITPEFWRSCDAVCDRNHWVVYGLPNCGKGEPMQVARTGHGAAPARFRNVRVGASALK